MNKQFVTQTVFFFFFGLLVVNVLYVLSGAVHFPLSHVDVIADWLYKAKYFYLYGIDIELLTNWDGQYAHPQYPILLPVFFSLIYQVAGGIQVVLVSAISSLVYVAVLLLCYFFLRTNKYSSLQAIVFTYCYSMVPPLMGQGGRYHAGMADIYLVLLYWMAIWVVWLSFKHHLYQWALVPIIIVASLIKLEGILLILCLVFAPYGKLIKYLQLISGSAGFVIWQLVVNVNSIPSSYGLKLVTADELIYRSQVFLQETFQEIFLNLNNWYFIWWLLVLLLVSVRSKNSLVRNFYLPVLILWVLGVCLLYLFSSTPIEGYASSSIDRLLLQSSPFWAVILFDRLLQLPEWSRATTWISSVLRKRFYKKL